MSKDSVINRSGWDEYSQEYQEVHGPQLNRKEFVWGVWSIPESELQVLGDVKGKNVLEIGCGAAQLSIAISHMQGLPVAVDNSQKQLDHAEKLMKDNGVEFPLHHVSAEQLPFNDEEFDIVFCDHGAMSFSESSVTMKEAYRVLKMGGLFAFNNQTPIHEICYNSENEKIEERLHKNYFELGRIDDEDGMISYQHSYGDWIKMFIGTGFQVIDLIELRPNKDSTTTYGQYVSKTWAQKWPAENIWKLRK